MPIQHLNFLLVEDHDFQRRALKRILTGLGATQITEVSNGKEALLSFQGTALPFDICIVDLNMPGMDGMELIRHLAEAKSPVSIILASALDRALISSVETMARAYGITLLGAIEKPATPATLQLIIDRFSLQRGAGQVRARSIQPTVDTLRLALELDQFEPYFQPKADLKTGLVTSAEALARWIHPELGLIPPDSFIPPMEAHGLIDQVTERIVTKTAQIWHQWHKAGQKIAVSINLSLASLAQLGYAERLIAILDSERIEPNFIVFEVTESAAISDLPHTLENLARLRMKGYGLSIDDYGTGYSSMQQLLRLPFSELKMDRSFVTNACHDSAQVLVLGSGISLARELRLVSVAEGVETAADWKLLRRLACDYAQGYLIGRPVPGGQFIAATAAWAEAYDALPREVKADALAS
ncbi:EAL domain-containing response regulator [Rugamonas sp.]|uniref:EAL domain-containing response regulator n=1 Tax=Rugamonas sp. TaxID=1926287 RepID=UPI0025F83F29|nr:EAL domain-containing response regulator [Rugamonas sp.]